MPRRALGTGGDMGASTEGGMGDSAKEVLGIIITSRVTGLDMPTASIRKALPGSRAPYKRAPSDNSLLGLCSSTTQVQAVGEGPAPDQCRVRGLSIAGIRQRRSPHENGNESGGHAHTCGVGRDDDGHDDG